MQPTSMNTTVTALCFKNAHLSECNILLPLPHSFSPASPCPPPRRALSGEAGIAFVKSLGATFVTDYQKVDLFDALPANSVDVVYDNYGAEGTADKAMRALRPGGVYLLMPVVENPP